MDQNYTLKEIAKRVKKGPTTISKEIKRNRFLKASKRKENDLQICQQMMNHINSIARASLNRNTPFKPAQMLLDTSLLNKLSLEAIPADYVHLKPALFKK